MSVTELHAGFASDAVRAAIAETADSPWRETLRNLSCFLVDDNLECPDSSDPLLMVADNITSRGLPTLPSLMLEDHLRNELGLTSKQADRKTGSVLYRLRDSSGQVVPAIRHALCMPTATRYSRTQGGSFGCPSYGSDAERLWLESTMARLSPSVAARIERQRPLASILGDRAGDFRRQDVDFALELPESGDLPRGFVFEIDGDQHETVEEQRHLDASRDAALTEARWRVCRIPASAAGTATASLQAALVSIENHPYGNALKEAFSGAQQVAGMRQSVSHLIHIPLCVARIEKVLIRMLCNSLLDIDAPVWRLGFVERDVPCAGLAVAEFRRFMGTLLVLEGRGRKLPNVEFDVFPLNGGTSRPTIPGTRRHDAILDVAVKAMADHDVGSVPGLDVNHGSRIIRIRSQYTQRQPRRISCGLAVDYSGLSIHARRRLTPVMRDIFRKVGFRKKQVDIIGRAIMGQSVVALLPTGAGKSLTYQLSCLLQPGIVIIVDPLKSLMRDQDDNLRKIGIDSTAFINSALSTKERRAVSKAMTDGQYQFVFISPERFQIPEFRHSLAGMKRAVFSFCVVDEAHCVSEWGHDFRTAYLRLGSNMRRFCRGNRDRLPVVALTGTASYDVLADVQRELDFTSDEEAGLVQPDSYGRKELDFEVVEVSAPDVPPTPGFNAVNNAVGAAKLATLKHVLRELAAARNMSLQEYLADGVAYPHSGVIFCPHVTGNFGVEVVKNGIAESAPGLAPLMGVYAGSIANEEGGDAQLEETQRLFKENHLNLLVATKAFGMGIDKPNIRFTAHFNMPPSIEAFYQEAGRAGRDRGHAACKLLFCPFPGPDGVTVDKTLMLSFFRNSFKGEDRELAILIDMLEQITFTAKAPCRDLSAALSDVMSVTINLRPWQRNAMNRLYVNGARRGETYGYFDVTADHLVPHAENAECASTLTSITSFLADSCPEGSSLGEWLFTEQAVDVNPGIEEVLAGLEESGPSVPIVIGFENGIADQVLALLSGTGAGWSRIIVSKASDFCDSPITYLENLGKQYWKTNHANARIPPNVADAVARLFPRLRTSGDTFKAIYRLSILGVIQDYEVDYNAKMVSAHVKRLPDLQYVANLQQYIGRYVSVSERFMVPEEVLAVDAPTILRRCMGRLLRFVYERIAAKREEAIDTMEHAAIAGIGNPDAFRSYVDTYFDSRFTPRLRPHLRDYSLDTVWEFIDEVGGSVDAAKHLRGACNRLLEANERNAALLLLRSYANFLITGERGAKEAAISDYRRGWSLFKSQEGWSEKQMRSAVVQFIERTTGHDPTVADWVGAEFVQPHIDWLKSFAESFTGGIKHVAAKP